MTDWLNGKTTISVLLEKNGNGYKCHPGSIAAYSAEVAHHAALIR